MLTGPLLPVLAVPGLTALVVGGLTAIGRAHRILLDHADLHRRL